MGTRSIIGHPYGDGFRGRYCHWDGYPTYNGKGIWDLVKRDGIEKAASTLFIDNYQWSSLNETKFVPDIINGEELRNVVPGYGTVYTDASPEDWVTWTGSEEDDLWCTEWAYIIDVPSSTMTIFKIDNNQVTLVTTINMNNNSEPDWEFIQAKGYGISEKFYSNNKESA